MRGNPVFSIWIPAGVYPDGNRGGNDDSHHHSEEVLETLQSFVLNLETLERFGTNIA